MINKPMNIKVNVDTTELQKALNQFRYLVDPYHLIVGNQPEMTLGYYEKEQIKKAVDQAMGIPRSTLGKAGMYNPFHEIGTLPSFTPHPAQKEKFSHSVIKETPVIKETSMTPLTLSITSVTPAAASTLHDVGGYGIDIEKGVVKITLNTDRYKQFEPKGLIFTFDGRALDPSYGSLSMRTQAYILASYKSIQESGVEIDKHVIRRNKDHVVFPAGTTEEGWIQKEYTLPDGTKLVIDAHGYFYKKDRPFTHGDDVIVTIQGEEIEGTYDRGSERGCFVDLGTEDGEIEEYVRVSTTRIRHA